VYLPDRAFTKDLKRIDKRLGVKFNGYNVVVTYDRGFGDPVNIWVVKGDQGGFRTPDKRDVEAIAASNIERESPEEKFQRVSKYYQKVREDVRRKARENIRDMTKDSKIQLRQAVAKVENQSKANSTFRRIENKPKGGK